ncbi:facilitated trehalose transporter Tret1-like [Atheta coriaria]|uniref:facilitated trehalose transporter Tret1-like n=1 Tax=Dalotia coriaria TaxID=877792 RepID=UPI0031F370F9
MSERKYFLRQSTAAFACFLESIGCGVVMSFTGTLFPQLEADRHFVIDKTDETWIASSAILSMAFGCIIGGVSMPHLTRKIIITSTNLLMIIGFLTLYYSQTVTHLLIGRILCGSAMGTSRPALVTIVAEVARPNLRTMFTNLIMLGHVVGALLSDVNATFLTWRTNALITCAYPCLAVIIFTLLPETYGSHVEKQNLERATQSFHWYRGYDNLSRQELTKIINQPLNNLDILTLFDKKFFKAFIICTTFFAAGQLNGVNVLSLYSVEMFKNMFKTLTLIISL